MASFEARVRELANRSDLKIYDLNSSRAKLRFTCKRNPQTLWIYPYDTIWEFSCVSAISFPQAEDFPQAILAVVLMQNSKNKRGFWCLEKLSDQYALECMQNFAEYLLTPDEFERTCWSIVREVDDLEAAVFE
jgi:hypothetical protein